MSKILLVGESWVSVTTHYKGFDHFVSGGYDTGVAWFRKAMEGWIEWEHMPSHEAQTSFPTEIEDLNDTKAIIISDVGADTFLLHPKTWLNGEKMPNRLKLIEEYVRYGRESTYPLEYALQLILENATVYYVRKNTMIK
mgnify:CR=1 FL=1